LKVLQFNINGIVGKLDELLHYMEKKNIKIGAIQETKLTGKSKKIKTPNYTFVRKDRGTNKGGGLAFLVHKDVTFNLEKTPQILEQDPHMETLTISLPGKNNDPLYIRNVYIPPQSSCNQNYAPPVNHLFESLGNSSLILGDVNAHHQLWHSEANEDARGRLLVDTITGLNFGVINEDQPTRVTANASTAPDVSIASSSLIPTVNWNLDNSLSSDHLPIIISLAAEITKTNTPNFTYVNYNKADWPNFQVYTENIFSAAREVTDVFEAEKYFSKIIQQAANKYIPAGRIPRTYNALPTEAARLIDERDNLKKNNPADNRIPELNNNINKLIRVHRKEKWQEYLATCQPGSQKLWKTVKSLNDQPTQPDNQGIDFKDNKPTIDATKLANKFNQQYTPNIDKKPEQALRNTLRSMQSKPKEQPKIKFTPAQTAAAIKRAKNSKAIGPDGLSPIMLKHLGPHGIKFLTDIFNLVLSTAHTPGKWKTAKIITLLKPGKPANKGSSYRPVSILSPPAKILEALILPYLTDAVELADHQHGFRKGRSTLTALQSIRDHIDKGLNRKKPVHRTVSVAIDLSRAFDTVDHHILLRDINNLPLDAYIKRFLCGYLRGRQTYVLFRNSTSKYRKVKQGVPQGGVLSPILFNLYMSTMPAPPGKIKLVTYADDSNVLNSGPKFDPIVKELNSYLATLNDWFKGRNLFISPSKSSATVFSTFSNDCGIVLQIEVDGQIVPTVKKPTFLGVCFDNLLSFRQHAANLKSKLQAKNNVLLALTGSTWGKDKETITTTFKAIGQSLINYCCPIWTPALADTTWEVIQVAQNAALRAATGCHMMSKPDHLHQETKIMMVKEHCEMLSKQFLLSTQLPNHPNRVDWNQPPPPRGRQMNETLVSKFGREIQQMSYPGLPTEIYKQRLKAIHTNSVRDQIANFEHNKVLGAPPPKICDSEKDLPRATRSTLAQLRSGYSIMLFSYKSRIEKRDPVPDICPLCQQPGHTTNHLFNCPANPTTLTPRDLWLRPLECARFLNLAIHDDTDDDTN
jgi:hypothetical protein